MDEFRTPVKVVKSVSSIDYQSRIVVMGSCFSENIGQKLAENKFQIDNHPFGIQFNPLSIKHGILRLLDGKEYVSEDLVFHQGVWNSFDHHGRFSDVDKQICLKNINQRLQISREKLLKADFLFLTFGTSYVYHLKSTLQVVSNCHKISSDQFERRRISIEEVVNEYTSLISIIREVNPDIRIVFTVSPVRHWKDGAHENTLSKSILLLAIDQLCKRFERTLYFPSYELMMDDLRDYRFYDEDMFHPSKVAIHYIWTEFVKCFMDSSTIRLMKEVESIVLARHHRPFNPDSEQHQLFKKQILSKIKRLQEEYHLSLVEEENYFTSS